MDFCEIKENCLSYEHEKCWICEDYSLYYPEDKRILCKRQIRQREERKLQKKELKTTDASKRGKAAKRKGAEGEREIVKHLEKYNIKAERVPLSGALKCEAYASDVKLEVKGQLKRAEVKRRKSGFNTLYSYIEQDAISNYVFIRQDNKKWLVVMEVDEFIDLVGE